MAAQNENALPNGTVLKHGGTEYRIERYLGAGGFGITYLVSGTAKVSGNTVTSKYCIKEHFLSSDCERDHKTLRVTCSKPARERVDDGKKDFLSEAKRLRDKIQHSHIVRVKDVFEAFDTAYYVMEFLDGKSLRNYIKKHGACGEEEAIALMLPIIRAIGYLHDQSITHLDIKPDNIMIVENERGVVSPTLIDFGLSKHYDKKGKPTSTIRVMATSDGYSPVEQYQGIETFQPTADIYALTATFVYCITGEDPKKSADIRPGEIRQLLKGKVSDSCLSALLNGMKPSQYERIQSVRNLMAELCPDEDSDNWDVETDNNITDPIFFRKRSNQSFFMSKLKGFFTGRVKKPKLLDMPDVSIVVDIKYPKGEAFSKRVYFCFGVCNTVFTYDGNEQVDDEDFFGGINGDVRDYFMQSRLLEDNHWESEQSKSDCPGNISVGITFHYKDGHEYIRAAVGVNKTNKLYQALHGLLSCKSIKGIVFKYDETHEPSEQVHIKTESIFLESTMLAYYNGMLTSINLDQWRHLNLTEKSKFNPYIVDFVIDNQRFGLFVEEKSNVGIKDVKSVLGYYEKILNTEGGVEIINGECRLLTSDEMFMLESNSEKLNNTLDEWGINRMGMRQWVMNNGYISSYPTITGPASSSSSIRPFVKYYGTIWVYQDKKKDEELSMEGLKLISFEGYGDFGASLYYCPQIASQLKFPVIEQGKNLASSFTALCGVLDKIDNSEIVHFRPDDETPIDYFWNNVKKNDAFILASNIEQFLMASKLQYQLRLKNDKSSSFRIINPIVLQSFWNILNKRQKDVSSFSSYMEGYECVCEFSDGVCEIKSISKTTKTATSFDEDAVIKGATVQKLIINHNLSDLLIVDIMEYEIALSIEVDGKTRNYIALLKANGNNFPARKTEEVSYDVIRDSSIYLYVGGERIYSILNTYCGDVEGDGNVSISVEIDADKTVTLKFNNKGNINSVELGELLSV